MMWGAKKKIVSFPKIILPGERILLRPPNINDHTQWAAIRKRCRDYLQPFEPLWTLETLKLESFERRIERQAHDWHMGRGNAFLIFKDNGQTLIGGMNINNICRGAAQYCTLGYWIDEAEQGKGYMREALDVTLEYCFKVLKLHRVNASTLGHNERSRHLLIKCGFEEEGFAKKYLQINGAWQDHILYGLPVESWKSR